MIRPLSRVGKIKDKTLHFEEGKEGELDGDLMSTYASAGLEAAREQFQSYSEIDQTRVSSAVEEVLFGGG